MAAEPDPRLAAAIVALASAVADLVSVAEGLRGQCPELDEVRGACALVVQGVGQSFVPNTPEEERQLDNVMRDWRGACREHFGDG